MDESVKQFSLDRWAKVRAKSRDEEEFDLYFLPGDITRLESDGKITRLWLNDLEYSTSYIVLSQIAEVESECNRALASLEKDIEKAATNEFIKRGMLNKLGVKQETN